jgi:hypothetical protein
VVCVLILFEIGCLFGIWVILKGFRPCMFENWIEFAKFIEGLRVVSILKRIGIILKGIGKKTFLYIF